MLVEDLLDSQRTEVLDEAGAALRRSGATHYEEAGVAFTA